MTNPTSRTPGLLADSQQQHDVALQTPRPVAKVHGQSIGGRSMAPPPPGSFATDLKSLTSWNDFSARGDLNIYTGLDEGMTDLTASEQKQREYRQEIQKQTRLKAGTENLLEALNSKNAKRSREQRMAAETQLNSSNRKIAQLKVDLAAEIQRSKEEVISPKARTAQNSQPALLSSMVDPASFESEKANGQDPELESPTYVLAEILQALEMKDMQPDYYVALANDLVELFRRHPTLKYDLVWSRFGLHLQAMLLSDSREIVAAGYRVMRYTITDRKSLQTIRALHTDYLVILSLVKDSKARVEREQALKFVRAFLDVKDGTREIHPAVARIVVAVADHPDDQLRNLAILTLAELLLKDPNLVISVGGISVLSDAMSNGVYLAPESLVLPVLHLMDLPARRALLPSGLEFSSAFATFTEPHSLHMRDEKLLAGSRVIATLFKSWPGLMTLAVHNFLPVRSIVSSLYIADSKVRAASLDLFLEILRIATRSWTNPFIGGRRLTTYARVAALTPERGDSHRSNATGDERQKRSLIDHFTAVSLAILLRQGLMPALVHAESHSPTEQLKRRTGLIITEVLKKSSELLPTSWSSELQAMPDLFGMALKPNTQERYQAWATVYQVDKVNLRLFRSDPQQSKRSTANDDVSGPRNRSTSKTHAMDEVQFRQRMLETGVLNSVNYIKWDWTIILELVDEPLTNPKNLFEATEKSKFVHRLMKFLRPFQMRFSDAANIKANQRYVRMACTLVKTLLQTMEGANYLLNNKTTRQLAECLAQLDTVSGITSKDPIFSPERLSETLVGEYFAMLGVMCSDSKGLVILERWHIINMFYHIVELEDRDDLIRCLLTNLDYTLDSHPRIILSKAMVAGSKPIRIMATKTLRKYAIEPVGSGGVTGAGGAAEWAIKLLVSQLYDPEIEVCEVAIKILEEACNDTNSLEYVVKCRPALDHLGEIGAPLLLRFLSTSVGYHYLDGLDYITREMDDWFLGRNDSYVTVVEASLAHALSNGPEKPLPSLDDSMGPQDFGYVPPHFYRELTRTSEGCELLRGKGHFEEFAATIQDLGMEDEDAEVILKVKGCLWAVGNVGSMELGAPFLERTDVVRHIVRIAEESQVLSLRGTAFFVLGLISRSLHGQEILAEYRWDGTTNVMGESLGYVLPMDFNKLFSIQPVAARLAQDPLAARLRPGPVTAEDDDDPMNADILRSVVKLGNTVLINKAISELNTLRHKKAPGFQQPALFRKVMIVLASHSYRIPQYRFVIDSFDKSVLNKLVLGMDDDEESDGSARSEGD